MVRLRSPLVPSEVEGLTTENHLLVPFRVKVIAEGDFLVLEEKILNDYKGGLRSKDKKGAGRMKELKVDAEFRGVNMRRGLLLLLSLLLYLSLNPGQVFSQQAPQGWLLGDVITLDLEDNQLTVGYIDYNSNEEKEITIAIDAQTRYENINSFKDIKVGDVVAIDYRVSPQGEVIALDIRLERLKEAGE